MCWRAEGVRNRHGERKMTGSECWKERRRMKEVNRAGGKTQEEYRKGETDGKKRGNRRLKRKQGKRETDGRRKQEVMVRQRQLKTERAMMRGGRGGKNKEGRERWVEGKSSYFNIKQHREEFNVPFTAPFACL